MRYPLLVAATLAVSSPAGAGDLIRCGSRLIDTGSLAAEVLAVCGEPDYRDAWYGTGETEEWYYDFGPNQLLRVLHFRHGRLVRIDSDGYGYVEPPTPPCDPSEVYEGLSKFRLLLRCGEPDTREAFGVLRPLHRNRPHRFPEVPLYAVHRERWVYDFGSRYFIRIVTLENGRVVDVDNGARGSDTR